MVKLTIQDLDKILGDIEEIENSRPEQFANNNSPVGITKEKLKKIQNSIPKTRPEHDNIRCTCGTKVDIIAFLKEAKDARYFFYCDKCNYHIPYIIGLKLIN